MAFTPEEAFDALMLVLFVGIASVGVHSTLAAVLRTRLGVNHPAFAEVFGSPVWGDPFSNHPRLIRAQFLWPFVSSPRALQESSRPIQLLFFATRLFGAVAVVGFVGFIATAVYIGVRSANS